MSTITNLVAWNGETYHGTGDFYNQFKTDPEFTEFTQDLTDEELLRLALYAYNSCQILVPEDLPHLISAEQENYRGESESEEEFTRELLEEAGDIPKDFPNYIVIDYQATWDRNLRHDFFTYKVIDIDGTYRQFFWWAY